MLAAMCHSSFRLYWAAKQENYKAKWGVTFDWREDPYLTCALPAIQINGAGVAVDTKHNWPARKHSSDIRRCHTLMATIIAVQTS